MNYLIPVIIIVCIAIIILLIKVVKDIMQILIYVILILILVTGVIGYFAVSDARNLAEGFTKKSNLFLLEDEDHIITGFLVEGLNFTKADSISQSKVDSYDMYFQNKDYKSILDKNYKLVVMDIGAFPDTDNLDLDVVVNYLKSKDNSSDILGQLTPGMDPKAAAFSLLVIQSMRKDPFYLVNNYRNNNVVIYPETFLFKVLKLTARGTKK